MISPFKIKHLPAKLPWPLVAFIIARFYEIANTYNLWLRIHFMNISFCHERKKNHCRIFNAETNRMGAISISRSQICIRDPADSAQKRRQGICLNCHMRQSKRKYTQLFPETIFLVVSGINQKANALFAPELLLRPQPGPLVPQAFKRPLLMPVQPPFAEFYLQYKYEKPYHQAYRIAAMRGEV